MYTTTLPLYTNIVPSLCLFLFFFQLVHRQTQFSCTIHSLASSVHTAAGVMRSRAVRRLQEPATWSPHLNLPGRPRLQRPAYVEPIESGTLPGFMEIPTAPTKNPKPESLKSTPGDAEQSTKRTRQEVTFQEPQPTSSSSGTVQDTSMQIPDPQLPKLARPLSPAEREDSIQKRQRPAEVNTALAIAGGDSRIEISTLTDDQKALHTAKVNELLNMNKVSVWWRWSIDRSSTRWESKQRLDGSNKMRLVAQFRYRFLRWNAKAHDTSRKSTCFWRQPQCISPITDAK